MNMMDVLHKCNMLKSKRTASQNQDTSPVILPFSTSLAEKKYETVFQEYGIRNTVVITNSFGPS